MQDHAENTKRIAKNTLMLYGRMLFSMVVSLYTSRVVLNTLGVDDFGIYNVVGGVVGMMSFLNASMSGATSRFMTYELGCGTLLTQRNVFSSAMIIHIGIALVVLIFAETLGLWFLENKLVIPEERMNAARIVFQLSVLSMIIGVTQVPYSACITSHEQFGVYAFLSIVEVLLRLIIVLLLNLSHGDKLVFYSILMTSVSVMVMCANRLYSIIKFPESRFQFIWRKDILYPMLSFSGWDLFGNLSVVGRTTGVNMLLNVFYGPVLNAASGIATQVQSAVMGIASNLVAASRPQIVKQYAIGEYNVMFSTVIMTIKLSFCLLAIISVPLILDADFVLHLWLGNVPQYAGSFCILTLFFNFFACMSSILAAVIHATGKVQRISIINGFLYISVLPVTYIAFVYGLPPYVPYVYNVLAIMAGMVSNAWTIKLYINSFNFRKYITRVLLRCIVILILDLIVCGFFFQNISNDWARFVVRVLFSTSLLIALGYTLLLDCNQRDMVKMFIINGLCRKV